MALPPSLFSILAQEDKEKRSLHKLSLSVVHANSRIPRHVKPHGNDHEIGNPASLHEEAASSTQSRHGYR